MNATRNSNSFDGDADGMIAGVRDESVIDSFPHTVINEELAQQQEHAATSSHYETFGGEGANQMSNDIAATTENDE